MKKLSICLFLIVINSAFSHCQIPCGIYDDQARINLMKEHVQTIEKSINELNKKQNHNQSVRWVINKENHAAELTDIITYYFMAQRIKPDTDNYNQQISLLHKLLINSMKAKQKIDTNISQEMFLQIIEFEDLYFNKN